MIMTVKRRYNKFHVFLKRLLQNYSKDAQLSQDAQDILNGIVYVILKRYILAACVLCKHSRRVTIDFDIIAALTQIWLPKAPEMLEEAQRAWAMYTLNTTKGITKGERAGLFLSPARVLAVFREHQFASQKIGESAYILLTGVVEAIIGAILERALDYHDRKQITGHDIYYAIKSQTLAPLKELLGDIYLVGLNNNPLN